MDISKIDKNFIVETTLNLPDVKFFDPHDEPFTIYGMADTAANERYRRMPVDVAEATSEGVAQLNWCCAGGRVAFKTDSPYIAIKAVRWGLYPTSKSTQLNNGGFDLYVKQEDGTRTYINSFIPPENLNAEYDSVIHVSGNMRDYTINFPNYGKVEKLYIGVKEGSTIEKTDGYRDIAPVVYYGSSITQGGCASRPGTAYQGLISHKLNLDFVNLGFSGNACGEQVMADYIAGLDMSVFVCDYDHNAPTDEHLLNTHANLVATVRKAHPELPIICMPRPGSGDDWNRNVIIRKTVDDAIAAGDKNIYYISGTELVAPDMPSECTVDGCHPTDLGFYFMAKAVEKRLRDLLQL